MQYAGELLSGTLNDMARRGSSNGEGLRMFVLVALGLLAIYLAYRYGYLQDAAQWLAGISMPRWQ